MTTRILVSHTEPAAQQRWQKALRAALPASFEIVDAPDAQVRHLVTWTPADDLFNALPGLQTCFSAAAGVDHLINNPSLPPELPVYRLLDAGMAEQMARYCRHEVERHLMRKADYESQQQQAKWIEHPARAPAELSVGVLGFGVLGKAVASTLAAEGYQVAAFRRQAQDETLTTEGGHSIGVFGGPDRWQAFLQRCEVLILLAPLTPATRHIINAEALAGLPRGAALVNVGRGALIDTTALLAALASGQLSCASLDVFEHEPLADDDPLWRAPGVRITPHVSALTLVEPAARQVAEGIMAFEAGQAVPGRVERNAGY